MSPSHTNRLDHDKLTTCPQCGDPVWDYRTPSGGRVALDRDEGPFIIDANGIAYMSTGRGGYRGHSDYCGVLAASPLTGQVTSDDFLWR
jgi:hypothetical protein